MQNSLVKLCVLSFVRIRLLSKHLLRPGSTAQVFRDRFTVHLYSRMTSNDTNSVQVYVYTYGEDNCLVFPTLAG